LPLAWASPSPGHSALKDVPRGHVRSRGAGLSPVSPIPRTTSACGLTQAKVLVLAPSSTRRPFPLSCPSDRSVGRIESVVLVSLPAPCGARDSLGGAFPTWPGLSPWSAIHVRLSCWTGASLTIAGPHLESPPPPDLPCSGCFAPYSPRAGPFTLALRSASCVCKSANSRA